jgi:pyruvate dehydrogenase E2 component (dihydrolipoamide acetyltransferase)
MRETIARRMQESVTTAPHFYVTTSVNMGEAIRLRETLKERSLFKGISMNHLVIKAVAYGLHQEPRVNAAMKDGQVFQPAQINIGIITALEDGLIIPVLKEVDQMSLKDVVFEARAAIERARAGRPSSSDLSGGTFSISNMGMFDVENFTAIINPGQGGILAVSAVKQQPVVQNGQVVVGSVMKATVSVDHRIIDGVMASTFLKHFKEALEMPALLMGQP